MDSHFKRNRVLRPWSVIQFAFIIYKFKMLSLWIGKRKYKTTILSTCLNALMGNMKIVQTFNPPVKSVRASYPK